MRRVAAAVACLLASAAPAQATNSAEPVTFASADGRTQLVGYLYRPSTGGRSPAVVLMHGRAGAYSSRADGVYGADTLSQRHQAWARLLASQGMIALVVDGFGPRGYPQGFGPHTYEDRPAELSEVTIRPLDAYGALAFLKRRGDVVTDSIALLGWSNGGSATLAALADDRWIAERKAGGFAAAVAFYPACRLKGEFDGGYRPSAPVRVFHGLADEETSPTRCRALVEHSRASGADIAITLYPGATHGFDDPGRKRQSVAANAVATARATAAALAFLKEKLGR
jgi:dienelactone hydrolase